MKTFPLTVSTPDGNAFREPVRELILRGSSGDLAVLAGHAPFVTTVPDGKCRIVTEADELVTAQISAGLLTVAADGSVTLLTGSFDAV